MTARYPNGWALTSHACLRMDQMGLCSAELLAAIDRPQLTYPGHRGSDGRGRQVRVAGRLAVVCAPDQYLVITVLWHRRTARVYAAA